MARPINVSNPNITMTLDAESKGMLLLMAQADDRSPGKFLRLKLKNVWQQHLDELPRRQATELRKKLADLFADG